MLLALVLAACSAGQGSGGQGSGQVVVQAAASLTDAFADLVTVFQSQHPDVTVTLNFAGSQSLATQIIEGAPADVFASANDIQMQRVDDAGLLAGAPEVFIANALTIVVESGNPFDIHGLADLANPDVVLVLPAPDVPAGAFAARALQNAGVQVTPASLELDVRSTLSKVELGEADAAIVYTSDALTAADTVLAVPIPEDQNVIARYPIAVLSGAPNPGAADLFVQFVLSEPAREILLEHAFVRP
ncbi:MAG: molybdate ABC transporter substrate-binding protein [Euzebya sp.]